MHYVNRCIDFVEAFFENIDRVQIRGFIYPLLAYEVILALVDQEFTTRNNDVSYPMMFKWTFNKNQAYDHLTDKIFGNEEVWNT